jgi:hypothetical protein
MRSVFTIPKDAPAFSEEEPVIGKVGVVMSLYLSQGSVGVTSFDFCVDPYDDEIAGGILYEETHKSIWRGANYGEVCHTIRRSHGIGRITEITEDGFTVRLLEDTAEIAAAGKTLLDAGDAERVRLYG